ncbi:MAG: hypothetical protein P1U83_15960 [Roseovarius sp.]|nr:hypothetical protein [Roseovarius sp.]
MTRLFALMAAVLMMAACTNPNDLDEAPSYLGNFHMGHNVSVAPNLTKGPASREASKEEWIAAMVGAMDERFGRYDGDKLYHFGISIEGYVLAVPGVPVVASPKSALILHVTVWDDAAQTKLNEEPHQVTVIESFSANTILGSGLTQSREKQMENLSRNAAKLIQNWMVRENNAHGWFEDDGVPSDQAKAAAEALKAQAAKDTTVEAPARAEADVIAPDEEG